MTEQTARDRNNRDTQQKNIQNIYNHILHSEFI